MLNWRDTGHPEAGGSEVYAESVADGLAQRGHEVVLLTARHPGAHREDRRSSGVRVLRRGGRLTVYLQAALAHWTRRTGRPEFIIETQNGVPYLAALWAPRTPHVVLVHHVHREQWPVVFGPRAARVGWWVESRLAPWVNRRRPYIAVSEVTRTELGEQGIDPARVRVIHNGTIAPPAQDHARAAVPQLLVLGRLVPHKRVELALQTLARLLPLVPEARLIIAGRGWWEDEIRAEVSRLGLEEHVELAGFVSDEERHRLYATSWVSLVPSLKEGWGLVVVEAGLHATPTVAFEGTGGVTESIVHGRTGLLARPDDLDHFTAHVHALIIDPDLRAAMGTAARQFASGFTWTQTVDDVEDMMEGLVSDPRRPRRHTAGEPVRQAELETTADA